MSGLAVLTGDRASPEAIERILQAAPNRGPARDIRAVGSVCVGVQGRKDEHPFVKAGVAQSDSVIIASVGCLYKSGSSILSGSSAASELSRIYAAHGIDGVAAVRGSFATVVVDATTGLVSAYRSHPGERPLFWRRNGDAVAFACELKQLRAAPFPLPGIDMQALLDLVAPRFDAREPTVYCGIERVPAGTLIETGAQERRQTCWSPRALVGLSRNSFADAVQQFRVLLRTAVERRLGSETVVLMSGGLDSTAVAAAAAILQRERGKPRLQVGSAIFPDQSAVDESSWIRAVVEALPVEAFTVKPRPSPFRNVVEHVSLHDGPSFAVIPCNYLDLLREARERGCTVALDGQDGDSLFGGYQRLVAELVRNRDIRLLATIIRRTRQSETIGWFAATRQVLPIRSTLRRAARQWLGVPPPDEGRAFAPCWVSDPLVQRLVAPVMHTWEDEQSWIYGGMLEQLLEIHERIALASNMTLLHPLSDPDLVDFFLTLPAKIKFATGQSKSLVRQGLLELPKVVRERQDKTTFDDLLLAVARHDDVAAAIAAGPRRLPGVDWEQLDALVRSEKFPTLEREVAGVEVRLLLEVLQADRLLADDEI